METSVVVVGGGVIGVSAAWELSARGVPVTIVEKGAIASGCSYGNAGYVCPSHSVPLPHPGVYLALPDALPLVEVWRGLRPCTPDGLPMIGRPRRWENLVIATGHAMLGLTLGPVTGRLVAQIIAGEKPLLDLAPLDPDRFA